MKSNDQGEYTSLATSRAYGNYGYILYDTPSRLWAAWSGSDSPIAWSEAQGTASADGSWQHVALQFDAQSGFGSGKLTGTLRLYVDGELVDSASNALYAPMTAAQGNPLSIGAGADTGTLHFLDGAIDELMIFDQALDQEAIRYLARQPGTYAVSPLAPRAALIDGRFFYYALPSDAFVNTAGLSLSYSAVGLPSGLSIDANSGAISGYPEASGNFALTIEARASDASSATQNITLAVATNNGYSELSELHGLPSGLYTLDLGQGGFIVNLDDSEGGNWLLALQYHHNQSNNAALNVIGAGANWPTLDASALGSDLSANLSRWGHAGNNALSQFSEALEYRWYGKSANHSRVMHFRSTEGDSYAKTGTGSFSALPNNFTPLTGHNSALPGSADLHASDEGDLALTETPFYEGSNAAWTLRGDGTRWEMDDSSSADTLHRVWVRMADTSNTAPTFSGNFAELSVDEGQSVSLTLDTSGFNDADGDTLSYVLDNLPSGFRFDSRTLTLSGLGDSMNVGSHTIALRATDPWGEFVDTSWTITVNDINFPPRLMEPFYINADTHVRDGGFGNANYGSQDYLVLKSDSNQFMRRVLLRFPALPAADPGVEERVTMHLEKTSTGDDTIKAFAIDSAWDESTVSYNNRPALGAEAASADLASDAALTLDMTNFYSTAAAVEQSFELHSITYRVYHNIVSRDLAGTTTAIPQLQVSRSYADLGATEDQAFSAVLSEQVFHDIDGDSFDLSITALPDWLSFDPSSNTLSGTPDNAAVGELNLQVRATDSLGDSGTTSLDISVANVNDAPTLSTPIGDHSSAEDTPYNRDTSLAFSDIDAADTLSYSASVLPPWLSLDSTTGVLSGTPGNAQVGTHSVTISATDSDGASVSESFILSVSNVNDAPTVANSVADQLATQDSLFSLPLGSSLFEDIDAGDSLQLAVVAPNWLGFANGTLSGTPGNAQVGDHTVSVSATDSAGATASLSFDISVANVNDPPSAAAQSFSVDEFARVGDTLGNLQGSDPDGDALQWTLQTVGSPFALSSAGQLSVAAALDFETTPSYSLSVQLSDGALDLNIDLSVAVVDGNEIEQLAAQLPLSAAQLSDVGVLSALASRETFYNNAIAAANPPPSTLGQLQALIDTANATADISESAGSGSTNNPNALIDSLGLAGVTAVQSSNAGAYESAIAAAQPAPTSAAELQAIVDEVNTVVTLASTVDSMNQAGASTQSSAEATEALALLLSGIDGAAQLPQELLGELAAAIARAEPRSEAEIIALVDTVIDRATYHPVLSLRLEQGGQPVQRIRPDGGTARVSAQVSNPVPGASVSFDWSESDSRLLALTSSPNPVTEVFSFEPASLDPGDALLVQLNARRDGLLASGQLWVPVTEAGLSAAEVSDADGDGILDRFEGALEASVDAGASNKLQTQLGEDLAFVMQSELGVRLRLGSVARDSQRNSAEIELNDLWQFYRSASVEQISDGLADEHQMFDFELTELPRAGSSTAVVIPLRRALSEGAQYLKYLPATGWQVFVEDGLNRVRSAAALVPLSGLCPQPGDAAYRPGLTAGHHCIELRIEDGGPNDADRFDRDGNVVDGGGVNGSIKDPGAVVYLDTAALGSNAAEASLISGAGGGSAALLLLVLLAFCAVSGIALQRQPPTTNTRDRFCD